MGPRDSEELVLCTLLDSPVIILSPGVHIPIGLQGLPAAFLLPRRLHVPCTSREPGFLLTSPPKSSYELWHLWISSRRHQETMAMITATLSSIRRLKYSMISSVSGLHCLKTLIILLGLRNLPSEKDEMWWRSTTMCSVSKAQCSLSLPRAQACQVSCAFPFPITCYTQMSDLATRLYGASDFLQERQDSRPYFEHFDISGSEIW